MTSDSVREPQIGTIDDLARQMKLARKKEGLTPVTFIIGAGCSVSAGIPAVSTIAKDLTIEAYKRLVEEREVDALEALRILSQHGHLDGYSSADAKTDWGGVYDALFNKIFSSPDQARAIFKRIVSEAAGRINWSHLALGELAAERWISTTITTNFDLLALDGYTRAGVIPVVSDGVESLSRIDSAPEYAQILQINGSIHSYRVRNATAELEEVRDNPEALETFRKLFAASELIVVIGYAGREPHIMDLLNDASRANPDKHIFWCQYSDNPTDLSENAKRFMAHSRNARLVLGQHSDKFFLDLTKKIGLGEPKMFRDPVSFLSAQFEKICRVEPAEEGGDVRLSEIADAQAALKERLSRLRKCDRKIAAQSAEVPSEVGSETKKKGRRKKGDDKRARPEERDESASKILRRADALYSGAQYSPDRKLLGEAVAEYRRALNLIDRDATPDLWAGTQNNLGNALQALGQRGDDAALKEAVAAFRSALEKWTRERVPLQWAGAQNNLGSALLILGERGDDAALKEAIRAYRSALEEYSRERVPLDWAMTQGNLGTALLVLGERGDDAALKEAIAAYRSALEEYTRERVPLRWAGTQHNLGSALQTLGQRGDDAALKEAVAAYRSALEEWTRERVPLQWAGTQNNLGNALSTLGQRGDDAALKEAAAQSSGTLSMLGERGDDAALKEGVAAHRLALEEYARERVPLDWAMTQNNLGSALVILGERGDEAALKDAIAAYRSALEEYTRKRLPLLWAKTIANLSRAREFEADRIADQDGARAAYASLIPDLEQAIIEFKNAGAAYSVENANRLLSQLRRKAAGEVP